MVGGNIHGNRTTATSNGCALIFVYMTYTMLPVRLREALFGGVLLSIVHIYFSLNNSQQINWLQVIVLQSQIHGDKSSQWILWQRERVVVK